jgi:hypothetical protein
LLSKQYFGGVGQLFDQNLTVGDVGVIVNDRNETAFYMITKKFSGGKSTMQTLLVALKSPLMKMKAMNLTKLGILKIGCRLDGLDWTQVKKLIASIFAESQISITICNPSEVNVGIGTIRVKKLEGFSPSQKFFNHYLSKAFFPPFTIYKKCTYWKASKI